LVTEFQLFLLYAKAERISPTLFQRALALTTGENHKFVAIDSTGISKINQSYHYIKRIDRKNQLIVGLNNQICLI